ncbi:Tyrosine-protein kinase receptor Tie-1 [Holothuria leucospilota]|uniref:Tyrosine-protein kinase receptor Tie-1 n=1 Tax=Holothuria leucospilota TaxID=206669 RepID=A0A9Q1C6Z4_HOLLE|nr:Tyrosine-protein kinase receptor Tie-1 [Holothuria leucospilota]
MASHVLCIVKILIAVFTFTGYKFNYSFAHTFSDVSVMVTNHLTSLETPAVITVFKTTNQNVTIYKAVLRGSNVNNQYLNFTGSRIESEMSPNGMSATLKLAGSVRSQVGVYTVTVSQDQDQIEMRVLILNSNAFVTPREYSTVVSIDESVSLFANGMRGVQESSLRWRKDGVFQGQPCFETGSCEEQNAQQSIVFECFVAGEYGDQDHAIMNLIVRGCPDGNWGPDCEETCPRCFNGGLCSDVTGLCQCPPGFSGTNCEQVHGRNVFGQFGKRKCNETGDDNSDGCHGALICYPNPFGCVCPAGYSGLDCTEECEDGTFGANCNQTCHCRENVTCAKDTGVCEDSQCGDGWKGTNCQGM